MELVVTGSSHSDSLTWSIISGLNTVGWVFVTHGLIMCSWLVIRLQLHRVSEMSVLIRPRDSRARPINKVNGSMRMVLQGCAVPLLHVILTCIHR